MTSCVPPLSMPEELEYWKKRAREMQEQSEMLEQELQDFRAKSVILEKEWKSSYEQVNTLNRELESENLKLTALQSGSILQVKLETVLAENEELAISVRKLEQENDKLSRHNREIELWARERMEQLDDLLEKLAITETELLDKTEDFKVLVQQLKEENMELKQQIAANLTQQNSRSSVVNGTDLATTFELSKDHNNSFDDRPCVIVDDLEHTSKDELLKRLQQLTQRFEALEIALRRSKATEQTMGAMYDDALEKIAFLETELDSTTRELTTESQFQLRGRHHNRQAQPPKSNIKPDVVLCQEEEKERELLSQSMPDKLNRQVPDCADKVEEEEEKSQQNFAGFTKRLRRGQVTRRPRCKD